MKVVSKNMNLYWLTYWWVWLLTYLGIWLIFGIMFWGIANMSSGDDFVFQEDILIKSKNIAFQKKAGIDMNYDTTKKLIANYKKDFNPIVMERDDISMITFNHNSNGYEQIGWDWAEYYWIKLIQQGYNAYSIEIINKNDPMIYSGKYAQVKIKFYEIPKDSFKEKQNLDLNSISEKDIKKNDKYYIWVDNNFFNENNIAASTLYSENSYHDISLVKPLLALSVNYLNNDIDIIRDYETNKNFIYPLTDFLYFSAITITTLGYGDILPNSSLVRGLVMIEVLFGVIIIAIFLSSSYDRLKEFKEKNKMSNNI